MFPLEHIQAVLAVVRTATDVFLLYLLRSHTAHPLEQHSQTSELFGQDHLTLSGFECWHGGDAAETRKLIVISAAHPGRGVVSHILITSQHAVCLRESINPKCKTVVDNLAFWVEGYVD